ncbi:MAG: O-antigen ligase family protein [Ancalomicrobiaceae bacterium]|nr:O-antigen ligase family protein [Ancalomicrobiaceae bacterium]
MTTRPIFASTPRASTARVAQIAGLCLVFLIVLISTGNFALGLLDPERSGQLQQQVVETLWFAVAVVSLPFARVDRHDWDRRVGIFCAFIFYAVLSSLWAGPAALAKGVVLAFNCFAVYLLVLTQDVEEVIDTVVGALFVLIAVSLALVLVRPDIAVVEDWQHPGQWSGVFDQKQTLGITSAILFYLAAMRFTARRGMAWRGYHVVVAAVALTTMVGSGSRGGAGLTALAVALGFLSKRFSAVARVLTVIPIAALAVSAVFFSMLWSTNADYLSFDGIEVDFTERTKIWKHAIDWITGDSMVFGYGLDGFWTRKDVIEAFLGSHTWVLDNYHNGYLAIFCDCGLIGVVLFLASAFALAGMNPWTNSGAMETKTLMAGFLALFAVINVTETYLLRSTNLASILFFFCTLHLFATERSDRLHALPAMERL